MTSAFDKRIVRVGIEIEGEMTYFEGLDIRARGRQFLSSIPGQCEFVISNLTREQRNFLLTHATPLYPNRKTVRTTLEVGRESYGTFLLYEGHSFACAATQPPDIGIILQSLTKNLETGIVKGYYQSGIRSLRTICQAVADSFQPPLTLEFHAKDKPIDNYSFTGSARHQIDLLNQMGGIQAAEYKGKLIVVDAEKAAPGEPRLINQDTGMVGIPQVTDTGVLVQMMIDNSIELAKSVTIESKINPAANGTFKVCQIHFEVANRDKPFYYSLFCSNLVYLQGSI